MSIAEELYHKIAASLPDTKESKMFGAKCVKTPNGKAAFMFWEECMVFKLRGEVEKDALSLDGCGYFNPMNDRPMKGWVVVPYEYKEYWTTFAQASVEYVRTLTK